MQHSQAYHVQQNADVRNDHITVITILSAQNIWRSACRAKPSELPAQAQWLWSSSGCRSQQHQSLPRAADTAWLLRGTSTQPQTHQHGLWLHPQLLLPQGLSPTAVSHPLHPSRSTQNTNALALRPGSWQIPNFSHSAAVVLLHLQGQTSGSPVWPSSVYVQPLDNSSPVLYLCHTKLMVLPTKELIPDVKSADKIFTNSTQIHSGSCQNPLMYSKPNLPE